MIGALALVAPASATDDKDNKTKTYCQEETHYNTNGIVVTNSSNVELDLTNEGVQVLTKTFDGSGVKWTQNVDAVKLSDVKWFSAWMKKQVHAEAKAAMPALFLNLTLPEGKTTKLTFEPYYQSGWDDNELYSKTFRADNGKWWANNDALVGHTFVNAGSYASNQTLAVIANNNPEAKVVSYGFQQNWAKGLKATVNDVKFVAGRKCLKDEWKKPFVIKAPQAPTFVDATCDGPAKLTIPAKAKGSVVWYTVNGTKFDAGVAELEDVATYKVEARTYSRFAFPEGATTSWEFKVTQPECTTPTTPPATNPPTVPPVNNGGNAGGLPVTGPQAAIIGGVGGLVLAVGAVLFVLARKRRVVTALPE